MYGAGRLESRNIREYEIAARYARDGGHNEFVDCLLAMAEVEWEHENYFRSRVLSHGLGRRVNLWSQPPAKEMIRKSFAEYSFASAPTRQAPRTPGDAVELPRDAVVISQHAE
jgi:hypothetical protein